MSQYFIYYVESSIICLIIFGIMLGHNMRMVDRSERVVRLDGALIAFMLYFISDAVWASMISGVIPQNALTVTIVNLTNFILMAGIIFMWFRYVVTVERVSARNTKKFVILSSLPLCLSVLAMIVILSTAPQLMINPDFTVTRFYSLFQVTVPIIYIIGILFFVLSKLSSRESPDDRRTHLYVGMFPLMVVIGGLAQVLILPETPIFCYCCTILMLIIYIQTLENRISIDPLTGLNNRGQLHRYIAQENALFREGKKTYVMMIDVNDFKSINDTCGHAVGDLALIAISGSLKKAAGSVNAPVFISRYGGDEFIFIAHSEDEKVPEKLVRTIRQKVREASENADIPCKMSVAIGYDELRRTGDSFRACLERADQNCYLDKERMKGGR